jgi:hypothetical protein
MIDTQPSPVVEFVQAGDDFPAYFIVDKDVLEQFKVFLKSIKIAIIKLEDDADGEGKRRIGFKPTNIRVGNENDTEDMCQSFFLVLVDPKSIKTKTGDDLASRFCTELQNGPRPINCPPVVNGGQV